MATRQRRVFWALIPLYLFLVSALAPIGCTCIVDPVLPPPPGLIACRARGPVGSTAPPLDPSTKTLIAGAIPGSFSVTSAGDPTYSIPLVPVKGRNHVEPQLAIVHDGSGNGVLGAGFSLAGASSIIRCPSDGDQDDDLRDVRFDAKDKLCLDNLRLVPVRQAPGVIEFRTRPDSFVKVIGHYPADAGDMTPDNALFFEALLPSGLVVEYGNGEGGKPLALGGVPRAFLATKARDGRGNAMTYSYCFADADGYTAEYALTEVRYTSHEGAPSLEPSRAVRFVYGTKDPTDIRTRSARGMALQSSLRLDEIQMLGPEDALARRYGLSYEVSPTTKRTILTEVEECGGDAVCKPPTRFQYKSDAAGWKRIKTGIVAPTSMRASPMLFDIDGDGLEDLIVPDADPALSTPQNPITKWLITKNGGEGASPPYFSKTTLALSQEWSMVANPSGPADPSLLQPELGTVIDYDQNGRADVMLHDVHGSSVNETVLLAQPDRTFKVHDTGIQKPFALGAPPVPPELRSPGASVHLVDLDGDGVADRIQCEDHGVDLMDAPGEPVWKSQLWRPAEGSEPAGFEPEGAAIEPLAGYPCSGHMHTADLNADRKIDIIVPSVLKVGGAQETPTIAYRAVSRRSDGTYETWDTHLRVQSKGGRVAFADVSGDGLPDAIEDGFSDRRLRTYINMGATFPTVPVESLDSDGIGEQDAFFHLAVQLDYNGDGRSDFLMPIPGDVWPNLESTLPRWFVLQATGALDGPTFTPVDSKIPFEAQLGDAITLADPRGPRVGDVNNDGAADVVIVLGGFFNIFQNIAADQDVLVGISDGMNDHDPEAPGFVPSVQVSYGHLTDEWITNGAAADDPALESYLYRSHADPSNDCVYPRRCVVGPRRVVNLYAVSDGEGGQRRFRIRYFDGRYHRKHHASLGFAKRIITDLETGAGVADFYDNATSFETPSGQVLPFAGQAHKQWRWYPALPGHLAADQIELFFHDATPTFVPANDDKTYFTLPTERRARHLQGIYPSPASSAQSIEAYVAEVESKGGASLLRDTTTTVSDFDVFGNVLEIDVKTSGVDLTLHIERAVTNDTERWVLGQLQTQTECSSASMQSLCRTLTRTTTPLGEVHTETTESDDESPEAQLSVVYERDDFGNVTDVLAEDAFGHHRTFHTQYDAEGIFPVHYTNAADHTTLVEFDARLGLLKKQIDPNQLVTKWTHDSFGRLQLLERPDGTQTAITLSRAKDGDVWRVTQRTATSGGADDLVEYDVLGRPVRLLSHGPDTLEEAGSPPRLAQVIAYDRLSGNVARRSVPISEFTPEGQLLFDEYEYDALAREVRHTTPWNATTKTTYKGKAVELTDPLLNVTVVENDALGRPLTITDAKNGTTKYTYGPFDTLYTVTAPGDALTRTTLDAFGRVKKLEDPDRGTTIQVHDGFSELVSSTDALGRVVTFGYDSLGRTESRTDQKGAEILTTTWTWDTAPNGIGKLHRLASPDGENVYAYNARGQLESLAIAIQGESELLKAAFTYDPFGHAATIAYPSPNGAAPFVVAHDYDAHGYMLTVRDDATDQAYWRLAAVDDAGRFRKESFGNGAVTERSYFAEKQALKSIVTQSGAIEVQKLSYEWDARLHLTSRTDALQPQYKTERFRHDALGRLTCSYLSVKADPLAPCAQSYEYAPSGNLTFKSDVGALLYEDPAHPHAVTSAGGEMYGYDAVGNQLTRPASMTISYTPFDLPKVITQGPSAITFGYDGDQARIRKTTPAQETLYFGDLYERVTEMGSAATAHRYYVHSPERVVAVVTRGGADPGTRYVHVDHLGSIDALTNDKKTVDERRSYDAFGQRRNPIWGQPPPAAFSNKTTKGFTGHERDDELGLVNMKGRLLDPRLGRFLTTDPVVSNPWHGQSYNAYSYVRNSPLTYIDPSGFWEESPGTPPLLPDSDNALDADGHLNVWVFGTPRVPRELSDTGSAEEAGAAVPPTDVDTTGSSAGDAPQGSTTAPDTDSRPNKYVQTEGGFLSGLLLGIVPYGALGGLALDKAGVLAPGTQDARFGRSVGEMVGGFFCLLGGLTGKVLGGGATVTGIGAAIGVPVIVVSVGLVTGGAANIDVGYRGLVQSLKSPGPGNSAPTAAPTTQGGTYKLRDPETGEVRRTGRTNDLNRRKEEHLRHPETKKMRFEVDKKTDSYPAQRGREQRIWEAHPEADLNRRQAIDPKNPRREEYLREGDKL